MQESSRRDGDDPNERVDIAQVSNVMGDTGRSFDQNQEREGISREQRSTLEFHGLTEGQEQHDQVEPDSVNQAEQKWRQGLHETASHDNSYLMVCLLFDDQLHTEFGFFADMYLKDCAREGVEPTELMKEVLLHSQSKSRSTQFDEGHFRRERRLRATRDVLEETRVALPHKPRLYRDMRWTFIFGGNGPLRPHDIQ